MLGETMCLIGPGVPRSSSGRGANASCDPGPFRRRPGGAGRRSRQGPRTFGARSPLVVQRFGRALPAKLDAASARAQVLLAQMTPTAVRDVLLRAGTGVPRRAQALQQRDVIEHRVEGDLEWTGFAADLGEQQSAL